MPRGYSVNRNICITFIQRRPNVFDVGPTLYKCYAILLYLLGIDDHVNGGLVARITFFDGHVFILLLHGVEINCFW